MSGLGTLVLHALRRRRGFLIATYLMLFGFQLFMILAARALEKSGGFTQLEGLMPDFLERWTNMVALSFRGLVLFGYSHPIVLLCLVALAISVGTEPAAEIESKFIDLLMARPLRRGAVVNRTVIVLVLATVGAIGAMLLGTWSGLRMFAPASARIPETLVILRLAVNLALVVIAWGAIALAAASFSKRRVSAAALCGMLAFATFVLDYVGRFWEATRGMSRVSPFHYFSPFDMIGGQPLPVSDVIVLLAIAGAGSAIAHIAYARRDL